jgi:hypothetical protein
LAEVFEDVFLQLLVLEDGLDDGRDNLLMLLEHVLGEGVLLVFKLHC